MSFFKNCIFMSQEITEFGFLWPMSCDTQHWCSNQAFPVFTSISFPVSLTLLMLHGQQCNFLNNVTHCEVSGYHGNICGKNEILVVVEMPHHASRKWHAV